MDFGFSPEQEQHKAQVRRFLDAECPIARVRTLMESAAPYDAGLWRKMADLGWLGLAIPEEHGGLGLRWEDVVVVTEEMGRSLFPSPFIAAAVAARAVERLASATQKARWLPRIAAGELIATLAVIEPSDLRGADGIAVEARLEGSGVVLNGTKAFVRDAQGAGLLLVAAREAGGVSLFAVEADVPGLSVKPLKLMDRTHRASNVILDGVQVSAGDRLGAPGKAWRGLENVLDAEIVAECGQMVGAADAAIKLAADYARVRKQFGQPIGRFQGVKHRLAELYVAVESARSLTYYASWAVDHVPAPARSVSMAKAFATDAIDRAGEEGVQIHGAIGFTWECDAHLYYKRGRYCRTLLGSAEYHRERVLVSQGL
jgi:alkylation response protein AidB-like acyl-CoA dehydrogenase